MISCPARVAEQQSGDGGLRQSDQLYYPAVPLAILGVQTNYCLPGEFFMFAAGEAGGKGKNTGAYAIF